ncbi:sodium:glutamate symporter [bacterium]|nr:sodium:glutamate symporter [bacterium]
MNFSWHIFINLGVLSMALLVGTLLRAKFKFFQKYLIPNALTAGFLVLPFYNFILPKVGLDSIQLGEITYHLLGLSFVALGLRPSPKKQNTHKPAVFATVIGVLSQIIFQAFLGLGLTFILMATIFPDLFPTFGFMLPLGFAEGPGQAYSIGEAWKIYGVENAGNIGLTFAALGFVICCFFGIFLINHGLRKGWVSEEELQHMRHEESQSGVLPRGSSPVPNSYATTAPDAIDSFSLHLALVFMTYFFAWLTLKGITALLGMLGPVGHELAANLWGLNFVWSVALGLLVRWLMKISKTDHVIDSSTITRVSGVCVDLMVTSAIAAISLTVVSQYWLPILVIAGIGSVTTFYGTIWFCSRLFSDHRFLRTLFIFGVSTGTISTGLALLRAVDPEFESPVAIDYTYASGIAFAIVIPLILIINLPLKTMKTGNPVYTWITFGVIFAYMAFILISYALISRKRAVGQKNRLWFRETGGASVETKVN